MRRTLTVVFLLVLAFARPATAQTVVVVPNAQATVAGNENNSYPFDTST